MNRPVRNLLPILFIFSSLAGAQTAERVNAITPPFSPLPPEAQSDGITKFSFIVYGDTRGRRDGTAIQYDHSMLVDSMLQQIRALQNTDYPIKFVLQSGDAVLDGREAGNGM